MDRLSSPNRGSWYAGIAARVAASAEIVAWIVSASALAGASEEPLHSSGKRNWTDNDRMLGRMSPPRGNLMKDTMVLAPCTGRIMFESYEGR